VVFNVRTTKKEIRWAREESSAKLDTKKPCFRKCSSPT